MENLTIEIRLLIATARIDHLVSLLGVKPYFIWPDPYYRTVSLVENLAQFAGATISGVVGIPDVAEGSELRSRNT